MLTIGALVLLLSSVPTLASLVIAGYSFLRFRYLHYLHMSLSWFFLVLGELVLAYSYLGMDLVAYRVGVLLTAPFLFMLLLLVDSVSRQSLDHVKFAVVVVSVTGLVLSSLEPGSVGRSVSALGETGPALRGHFLTWGSVVFGLGGLFWFYYMLRIYLSAPASLRRYALLNLFSAGLAGPGAALVFVTGLVWFFPGLDYLLVAVASSSMSYAFWREPRLAFVLPFEVYSLHVVDSEVGMNVFSHHWRTGEHVNDDLFTAALQGISMLLKESFGGVMLRELVVDQGHLLLERRGSYTFVLFCSARSSVLRDAHSQFAQQFVMRFGEVVGPDVTRFREATALVEERFPFVVEHL